MRGKYRIIVSTKRLKYDFELRRNLTIIQGDSATGKTPLMNMETKRIVSEFKIFRHNSSFLHLFLVRTYIFHQRFYHILNLERFWQVRIHAGFVAGSGILVKSICGHGDDRNIFCIRAI